VNEAATVKVNGQPAKTMSTDGGAPFRFEGVVDLDAGANTVVVEARDGNNNVSTKSYTVTTAGTTKTYEYDGNGNLRYEKQPNGTVIREYRWDQQNRLVRAIIGTHESVYEYDGESRRVRINELTSSVETKNETFVWCGSRICQKRTSTGSTVLRSYFGNGFEESGTTDYFYTRDHLGSVREVVASDGTTIGSRLLYSPWGEVTETGSVLTDFAFTGHHYDRPTGLSLTHYRAYDGHLGRWTTKDPIRFAGGLNLYGYCENDPINCIDPSGLDPSFWDRLKGWFGDLLSPSPASPSPSPVPGPTGSAFGPNQSGPTFPGSFCQADGGGGGRPGASCNWKARAGSDEICPRDPAEPERDCSSECAGYLGRGGSFPGRDGWTYKNDLGGQWAFQRCYDECMGKR
jgi:RHS repeat-associated protein